MWDKEKENERIEKMLALGIKVDYFDAEDEASIDKQQEKDITEATILILGDKEIPKDLEIRLLNYKKKRESTLQ